MKLTELRWKDIKRGARITLQSILIFIGAIAAYQLVPTPIDPPKHTIEANGTWVLQEHREITVGEVTLAIEPGFHNWDGLSIPAVTTNRLQVTRYDYEEASLFHDAGYSLLDKNGNGPLSKAFLDEGLEILLVRAGCLPVKAAAIRQAVDAWGFAAIAGHTPESIAAAGKYITVRRR